VGEAVRHGRVEPRHEEELLHLLLVGLPARDEMVHPEGLADDGAGVHAGVERAVGVLEDDGDALAQVFQGLAGEGREVLALEEDVSPVGR